MKNPHVTTRQHARGGSAVSLLACAFALAMAVAGPATARERDESRVQFQHDRLAQAAGDRDGKKEKKEKNEKREDRREQAARQQAEAAERAREAREESRRRAEQLERIRNERLARERTNRERGDRDDRHDRDDRDDRNERNERNRQQHTDRRFTGDDRRPQYDLHRDRDRDYRGYQDRREHLARERAHELQRQRRMQQYRYQQLYQQRLREQQRRWAGMRYDYNRDPFYSTPFSHRYQVGGRYWQTNRYGVDLIRQAANHGYAEGIRAGQADRYDGWRADYRGSWAYQDASYGYQGRYIDRGHYAHYFREGFRRGYEDGYYSRAQYGRHQNGQYLMISTILSAILGIRSI